MKLKEEYGNSEEEMRRTCESSDYETDNTQTSDGSSNRDEGCGGINWKMHVDAKGHKLLSESCVTDENDNTTVRVKPVENRTCITFRTDKKIKVAYDYLFKFLRVSNGSYYGKQNMWDDIAKYGYQNLPECRASGILDKYRELRGKCFYVISLEMLQPVDFNQDRRSLMSLYLTKEQLNKIEGIKDKYFIDGEIFQDLPFTMLITSFIYSDYKNNLLVDLRDVVSIYYDEIQRYVSRLDNVIYNLNVRILERIKSFPVDKAHLLIDYLNYLTTRFDEIKDYNSPDIIKQIELITEYCEYVNKYTDFFRDENPRFNIEEFGRLYDWTRTKKI